MNFVEYLEFISMRNSLQVKSINFTCDLASYGVQLVEKTKVENEMTHGRYTIPEFYDEEVFSGTLEEMDKLVRNHVIAILISNRFIKEFPELNADMFDEYYKTYEEEVDIEVVVRKGEHWTEAMSVEAVDYYIESIRGRLESMGIEVIKEYE